MLCRRALSTSTVCRRAIQRITIDELQGKLDSVQLIDLRTGEEVAATPSIASSVHFPMQKRVAEEQAAREAWLKKQKLASRKKSTSKKKKKKGGAAIAEFAVPPRQEFLFSALSIGDAKFHERYGFSLTSDKMNVFISDGTTRAQEAAEQAEKAGLKQVAVLEGGMRLVGKLRSAGSTFDD